MIRLYFPIDEIVGNPRNYELAADFMELAAFSSASLTASLSVIANEASIGASDDYRNIADELEGDDDNPHLEELTLGVAQCLNQRRDLLNNLYPFSIDPGSDVLKYRRRPCADEYETIGRAAYVLSLLLSNLRAVSPILDGSDLHPNEQQIRELRQFFQYFATAAVAADIGGDAWSFGFPRPDGSGFLQKLKEIWKQIGDGAVQMQPGAPARPKDDQVDVFAARRHKDGLPGFPMVAAQVATGQNYRGKSISGHIKAFRKRWYLPEPVTEFTTYMIVPFVMDKNTFIDTVRVAGNVLHRTRVTIRAAEAAHIRGNKQIEGYEFMIEADRWIAQYHQDVVIMTEPVDRPDVATTEPGDMAKQDYCNRL